MRERRGWTLLELAVAVALAAVFAALTVLRVWEGGAAERVRASARAVGNAVRVARERASLEETSWGLFFETGKGGYAFRREGGETLREGALSQGVVFYGARSGGRDLSGAVRIVFGPRGILPETRIVVGAKDGPERAAVRLGSWLNEVAYEEFRQE